MEQILWIIPVLPLLGFLILSLGGKRLSLPGISKIGVGSLGLAALLNIIIGVQYLASTYGERAWHVEIWKWFNVGGLSPGFAFYFDALTLVFTFVITFVGFLIHLYSSTFMAEEEGYSRFFAYMNLFVAAMLVLVMADNLVLLYLGWEGVGLCSFLLIGFWYSDPANGYAARKAFIITRVGDTAMAIGLFLLFTSFDTLNIQEILHAAPEQWNTGSTQAFAAALLLLGGAVGKSAQLPLQTWLPDAMAGPSPVSALIHAATMVTAGVYLLARTHVIFTLSPVAMQVVAGIGLLTLLMAGFSALNQRDIKRVLAYSTISQIGYMFLALGVGAWSAAVFHFMIHAFFKALLFLGAGVVIMSMHHEHDMFKMGGLKNELPVTFITFLIGAASLAALPLVTAGFYSKDLILWQTFTSVSGGWWLWIGGLLGSLITSIYTSRMVFVTFFGPQKLAVEKYPGSGIKFTLIVLAGLSIGGGFIELPHTLGDVHLIFGLLHNVLPELETHGYSLAFEAMLQLLAGGLALAGVFIAYAFYIQKPDYQHYLEFPFLQKVNQFFGTGWQFDRLYDLVFVKPFVRLSQINQRDFINSIYTGIALVSKRVHQGLSYTQTGQMRWYLMGIVIGSVITVTIILFL